MRQTDGRAITNPENAQCFSHAEIKQAADEMNPGGLADAFDAWFTIAAAVTTAGAHFETAIRKAVELHWEGAAADRAVLGIREFAVRLGELGESLDAQSEPLSAAVAAAARFKAAVPEVTDGGATGARGSQIRNAREEQARDDMHTCYIQPYGTTAPTIPTLPPPVRPVAAPPGEIGETDTGADPGTPKPSESGTAPARTGTSYGTMAESKSAEQDVPESPPKSGARPDEIVPQSVSQTVGNDPPTGHAPTTGAPTVQTAPATFAAPQLTAPAPSAVTPASVNSTPSGATLPSTGDSPNVTSSPSREPSPGTARPAPPGSNPAAAEPQSVAAQGRAGAPGAAGYSNMIPPRASTGREDDGEHRSPTYLRSEDHPRELLGEVKPTVPPALGAD